jgi:hypothetical protein
MAVSDVLGKFRQSGYSEKGEKPEQSGKPESVRVLKLTDEEKQALEQVPDGKEVKCDVMARKSGDSLTVMSVAYTEGDNMDEMAKEVAGSPSGGPPLVNNQVQPSPS